jgi:hypothetical protein
VAAGYQPEPIPAAPIYFPTWANKDLRLGAPEECALRPPADAKADASDMQKWIPEAQSAAEPAILTKLREAGVPPAPPASTLTGLLAYIALCSDCVQLCVAWGALCNSVCAFRARLMRFLFVLCVVVCNRK